MLGIKIGNVHTYTDWGLILTKVEKSFPEPKTETQDIPGKNGVLDLTEALTDDVKYKNRKLTFTFSMIDARSQWDVKLSTIENHLHGKRMQIVLDSDKLYYYEGRCTVDSFSSDKAIGKLVIVCDAAPYKYELEAGGAWIWDTFNFEDGVIAVTKFTVSGSKVISITSGREIVSPTFVCDSAFSVTYNNVTYNLPAGTTKVLDIRFKEGSNRLTLTGNGTIEVRYKGGSL